MKTISIISVLLFTVALSSQAQRPAGPPPTPEGWVFTTGIAAFYSPTYEGADEYGFSIFPNLEANYRDVFSASVGRGARYNLINEDNFKLGPLAKIRFGRDEDGGQGPFTISGDTDDLLGLGDIDTGGEIGAFFEYSIEKIRISGELLQGFGAHEGLVGELSVVYADRAGPLIYSFGPRIKYGGDDYMETYFGINPTQSVASGLPIYDAGGGITSYGIGLTLIQPISRKLSYVLFAGYDQIAGDAADSPIVADRGDETQITIGFAISYRLGN